MYAAVEVPIRGFIAQMVEHCTGIVEVMGSKPVEALIFLRLLLSNCLNWKFTAMIILPFKGFIIWLSGKFFSQDMADSPQWAR